MAIIHRYGDTQQLLTLTTSQNLGQYSLDDYQAIVLVEGSEAQVFTNPKEWFAGYNVIAIDCGGFPGVGAMYSDLISKYSGRVVPCVDQDSLEQRKSTDAAQAWNSPNLHIFSRTFEDEFHSWVLAEAISSAWSHPEWEITEIEITHVRSRARKDSLDLYEAIENYGKERYQGFLLPGKPAIAQAIGDIMWRNYWLAPCLESWLRKIYSACGAKNIYLGMPTNSFEVEGSMGSDSLILL